MQILSLLIAMQAGAPLPPPAPLPPDHICPSVKVTAHKPIPLASRYDIIGLSPDGKTTYHGTLTIKLVGNSYQLTRAVGGKTQIGKATMERCEGAPFVHAIFPGKPRQELRCNYGVDFDNFVRVTCLTKRGQEWQGKEAWFERSAYAP
jgi:hypothetical protein